MSRGGTRKGAGRKRISGEPMVTVTIRLPLELRDELTAFVKSRGIPIRVFITDALRLVKSSSACEVDNPRP